VDRPLPYIRESTEGRGVDLEKREGNADQGNEKGEPARQLSGGSFLIVQDLLTQAIFLGHSSFPAKIFSKTGSSFLQKRESRRVQKNWMPASAGMTRENLGLGP
jgi:hypothetical protein